jgi:hypothetical protein
MFETEKHNWRSVVLLCMALVCTIPPDALALDGVRGSVRTEVETGHTMLGRIVTDRPRWVVDSTIGWLTEDFGRATFSVWTASELSPRYDDERRRYFNEIDPKVGYGYEYAFADGWSIDTLVEFQYSAMHYADTPNTFYQWIGTETLRTPWLDVYGFAWVVTHPYRAPAYRIGFRREYAIAGPLSVEPHIYFDLGPERWNRRRFGDAAGDADYRSGFNAVNFHLLFKWALADGLSLYAGVRQFDALTHEVRRQTRARARRDETDFTYFAVGIIWCF